MGYGFALLHSNNLDKAIHHFKEAIAFHESWQALKGLGQAYFERKMYDEANYQLDKSLEFYDDCKVYMLKAELSKISGNVLEHRKFLKLAKSFERKILYIHSNTI